MNLVVFYSPKISVYQQNYYHYHRDQHAIYQQSLQWGHNRRDGVSNHQPRDCFLNRLVRRSKKMPKLRVTGLWVGNLPVTSELPTERASNAGNVPIWWRHHNAARCDSSTPLIKTAWLVNVTSYFDIQCLPGTRHYLFGLFVSYS